MASSRRLEALLLILCGVSGAAVAADRVTYCCQDDAGHQNCGDVLPTQCYNKAYRVIGGRGLVLRQVETPLTPEQRAQQDEEKKRKKIEEKATQEQRRKDQALLETYANEKEIDEIRDRSLRLQEQSLRELQTRRGDLQKKQRIYATEAEFYTRKPMPAELRNAIKDIDIELNGVDTQREQRQREIEATRAKFDDEKRRFLDLKHRGVTLQGMGSVR